MNSRMNAWIVMLFFLCTSTLLYGQNELSGTVSEKGSGRVLAGVSVYIPDLHTGTLTDSAGHYRLQKVPAGQFLLEISAIGYETALEKIDITGLTKTDFLLRPSVVQLKDVIVTGVMAATDKQNNPFPVAVMSHIELQQQASTNIIDAITRVPGVSAITDGQSISKPVIRGLGYNRVVTVADGVPQQGQQWGDEFGIEVDQQAIDRVEILKGPASLVYGSDAISGVVNLLAEPVLPEGEVHGDILLNYQTNNGLIANSIHTAGHLHGIAFNARIDNTMAHAYQNPNDGYVLNSQFSNFNAEGTLGIHRGWGFSQLHYSYFDLRTGIVDGTRDSATGAFLRQDVDAGGNPVYVLPTSQELKSYTPLVINQAIHHQKLVWDNSLSLGKGRITGTFAWQQNRRQENNDPTIPNTSNIYYLLHSLNYDLRYISPSYHDFSFSTGVNGLYQNSKNKGTLLLIPEYDLFNIGAFVIVNKKIGNLNLSGGLRYDSRHFSGHDNYIDSNGNELSPSDPSAIHRFSAYHSNFQGVSGSIGAVYQFNSPLFLRANIARGFRAPNVAESGSNGIHDGTVVYEIGDPGLKPESNIEFDLAPGINSPDFSAELDFFVNSIHNYIYPNALKSVSGGDSINNSTPGFGDAPVFKYQQGNAMLTGGEASLDIHPQKLPWMDWYTAFSTVAAILKDQPAGQQYPPFIPPSKLQSDFKIRTGSKGKVLANSYLKLGVVHCFEQQHVYDASAIYMGLSSYELAASLAPTKGYTLLNAGMGSDMRNSRGKLVCSVFITVNNLLNTAYMDYMSRFKYYPANYASNPVRVGVYNMGRNLSFKLVIPLDFTN